MAEEHNNWDEASNHTTMCANNYGFSVEKSLSHSHEQQQPETSSLSLSPTSVSTDGLVIDSVPDVVVKSQPRNRCGSCKRRVGLTGFTCRCGTTFCGTHRYPEEHGCTFDYKIMGKEMIAKENPVVIAAKLQKI